MPTKRDREAPPHLCSVKKPKETHDKCVLAYSAFSHTPGYRTTLAARIDVRHSCEDAYGCMSIDMRDTDTEHCFANPSVFGITDRTCHAQLMCALAYLCPVDRSVLDGCFATTDRTCDDHLMCAPEYSCPDDSSVLDGKLATCTGVKRNSGDGHTCNEAKKVCTSRGLLGGTGTGHVRVERGFAGGWACFRHDGRRRGQYWA